MRAIAPDFTQKENKNGTVGYPSGGARLGPAWQACWDALSDADDWLDGTELSEKVANMHGLSAKSVRNLLTVACTQYDLLLHDYRVVNSRQRTHYKIKAKK